MFGGLIDEVAVYRTALSAARIQVHYQKGQAIDNDPPAVTLSTPGQATSTLNTTPHFAGNAQHDRNRLADRDGEGLQRLEPDGNAAPDAERDRGHQRRLVGRCSAALPLGTYTAQAEQTDVAGNIGQSAANTFSIVPRTSSPDPMTAGAGDIADCTDVGVDETASLILGLPSNTPIFTLGDNAYPDGSARDFANCYDPTWGQFKARTRPAIGDHEYDDARTRAGYFNYFHDQLVAVRRERDRSESCLLQLRPRHLARRRPQRRLQPTRPPAARTGAGGVARRRPDGASEPVHDGDPRLTALQLGLRARQQRDDGASTSRFSTRTEPSSCSGATTMCTSALPPRTPGYYDPTAGVRQIIAGTGGGSLYSFGTIRRQQRGPQEWLLRNPQADPPSREATSGSSSPPRAASAIPARPACH